MAAFQGVGIQHSGSGNISVGGDLNIVGPSENHTDQLLIDLYPGNPRDDKARIEATKGGLLKASSRWILEHPDFLRWRDGEENHLLWIRGGPGKGKTMLLCGIIDELQVFEPTYFFCQATDAHLNNATAVLRGLASTLVRQHDHLSSYFRDDYKASGKGLFEGRNSWFSMARVMKNILGDPSLLGKIVIVDALDECSTDQDHLLSFLTSDALGQTRWIVSSRNQPRIEEYLKFGARSIPLLLELNENAVSEAVEVFIRHRARELAYRKNLSATTQNTIQEYLSKNAENTFLWVALVCQELIRPGIAARHIIKRLQAFPPGLEPLYRQMIDLIRASDDLDLCCEVLAVMSVVYRPVVLQELATILESLAEYKDDPSVLHEIISSCGSFLTVRDDTVYFVHQSAKDFLLMNDDISEIIMPAGDVPVHHHIAMSSMIAMAKTLRRNIYKLENQAADKIERPDPDPLDSVIYCLSSWAPHLRDAMPEASALVTDDGFVRDFLEWSLLHWLEGLCLVGRAASALPMLRILNDLTECDINPHLSSLIDDAITFVTNHLGTIELYPLQIYASCLIFSPRGSIVRELNEHQAPDWIIDKPETDAQWGPRYSLLGVPYALKRGNVNEVIDGFWTFSPDDRMVASVDSDGRILLWDVSFCQLVATFTLANHCVAIIFTRDSRQLRALDDGGIVTSWDTATGDCHQETKLAGPEGSFFARRRQVSFSLDGERISGLFDHSAVCVWEAQGDLWTLRSSHQLDLVSAQAPDLVAAVSPDGMRLAIQSGGKTWIVDVETGHNLPGFDHDEVSQSEGFVFSPNSKQLACTGGTSTAFWDVEKGARLFTCAKSNSVAYSRSGRKVAAAQDALIRIYDADALVCKHTVALPHRAYSVGLSCDGEKLVAALEYSLDARFWNLTGIPDALDTGPCNSVIIAIGSSPDGAVIASALEDGTVEIRRRSVAPFQRALTETYGTNCRVTAIGVSPDSRHVVFCMGNGIASVWDALTPALRHTLDHASAQDVTFPEFSAKGLLIVACGSEVHLWDAEVGTRLRRFRCNDTTTKVTSASISLDGTRVASLHGSREVFIWETSTGTCLKAFKCGSHLFASVLISPTGQRLAILAPTSSWQVLYVHITTGDKLELDTLAPVQSLERWDEKGLHTDVGILPSPEEPSPRVITLSGLGVDIWGTWVLRNGTMALKIPSEFAPRQTGPIAFFNGGLAWGCKFGRLVVISGRL